MKTILDRALKAATALIAVAFVFVGCSDEVQKNQLAGNDEHGETVRFVSPIDKEGFTQVINRFDLKAKEVNFQLGEITVGYTMESDDLEKELGNALLTHSREMLKLLQSKDLDPAVIAEIQKSIQPTSPSQMRFVEARVLGSVDSITRMSEEGIIEKIHEEGQQSPNVPSAPQSLNHESWAPYGGTSIVQTTYISHTMYFNNVSAFGSSGTYEHETQVYDTNYANYGGYWSSNLPRAYKDTQFNDSIDNFTVGSANASSIATFGQYYTYMTLSPQQAVKPTVRIKGQRGHRWPSWCYSTWCIFPDETSGTMIQFTAPMNGISWQY